MSELSNLRRRIRRAYNLQRLTDDRHPSFTANDVLNRFASDIEHVTGHMTHGTEGFTFGELERCNSRSWNEGITYLNTGDPYLLTVLFDSQTETFHAVCYGDYIEMLERN